MFLLYCNFHKVQLSIFLAFTSIKLFFHCFTQRNVLESWWPSWKRFCLQIIVIATCPHDSDHRGLHDCLRVRHPGVPGGHPPVSQGKQTKLKLERYFYRMNSYFFFLQIILVQFILVYKIVLGTTANGARNLINSPPSPPPPNERRPLPFLLSLSFFYVC